jgi:enamine deaminase RidA (YjgF/YER057c/UK114 family)
MNRSNFLVDADRVVAHGRALAGMDSVLRVVKVVGFVASAVDFAAQPDVVNGASNLLADIFGSAGTHARSAVGVANCH